MHDDWPHNFRITSDTAESDIGDVRVVNVDSPKLRKTILNAIETKREIWDLQDTWIYISDFPHCKNPYRRILGKIRDTEQLLLPEITSTTYRNSKIKPIDDVLK